MFISCEETKKLIKEKNAQFVDVRTPPEYQMSKLPGAINIPLQELEARANELDKSLPVIVFCRSGSRSHMAQQILQMMGFSEVYNMGPYTAWYQCPDV
ncbi:Rhodanese-related sulfurtransferase [Sulfurivirga caldicuralii]|uniref:Rhodanese-related sulfurtransferase n=1 Tax=Sulfurivirga caldicuralii TaxID=364032 RepID=A0A1N6EYD2_9GAMM|nr:rhodanese-like domain-containing protein [Sulfurivirga caldicuralii]SIN88020.1 Rhodanese-related sulfurtransferase [Sulfurivirga caldicuralii]